MVAQVVPGQAGGADQPHPIRLERRGNDPFQGRPGRRQGLPLHPLRQVRDQAVFHGAAAQHDEPGIEQVDQVDQGDAERPQRPIGDPFGQAVSVPGRLVDRAEGEAALYRQQRRPRRRLPADRGGS